MFLSSSKGLRQRGKRKIILAILILCFALSPIFSNISFAEERERYQVVAGSGDNAYLVDTATGYVWILTYRTQPTGREPVAIPYKFIGVTPQNQGNFLVERAPGVADPAKDVK